MLDEHGLFCGYIFSLASALRAVIFVSLFLDPEFAMKTMLCVVCALVMSGCVSSAEETWPRITVEMRVLLVDEHFLEEAAPELERCAGSLEASEGAFVSPVDADDENLLVTMALANQHCRSIRPARATFAPGRGGRNILPLQINAIVGLEPLDALPHPGVYAIDVTADFANPDISGDLLCLVVRGGMIPRGVNAYNELEWVPPTESGSVAARVNIYPWVTFRAQSECQSGTTYLIALPMAVGDGGGIAPLDMDRRVLVLVRPMVLTSREQEDELYPGLIE